MARGRQYCKVNLPDTVVLESGSPVCWLYSGPDGLVHSKTEKQATMEKIRNEFLKDHMYTDHEGATRLKPGYVAVLQTASGSHVSESGVRMGVPGQALRSACLAYQDDGLLLLSSTQPIQAQAFQDMTKAAFPADSLAVQRYVKEKGYVTGQQPTTAMYFHEYK